jgi:hypothetical protein
MPKRKIFTMLCVKKKYKDRNEYMNKEINKIGLNNNK